MPTIAELEEIRKFRDERGWMKFHNPKNLACSNSIEANEGSEIFQWSTPQQSLALSRKKKTEISHEIADVAVYLIELADNLDIDLKKPLMKKWRTMKLNILPTRCEAVPKNTRNTKPRRGR